MGDLSDCCQNWQTENAERSLFLVQQAKLRFFKIFELIALLNFIFPPAHPTYSTSVIGGTFSARLVWDLFDWDTSVRWFTDWGIDFHHLLMGSLWIMVRYLFKIAPQGLDLKDRPFLDRSSSLWEYYKFTLTRMINFNSIRRYLHGTYIVACYLQQGRREHLYPPQIWCAIMFQE